VIGQLRYGEHRSIPEIHQRLESRGVGIAQRTVGDLLERYEELVALHLADEERLQERLRRQGQVILAIDGMQPDVGHEVLWVIRDSVGLTGTKFGCGMALCGACTVHLDGKAIRSCVSPLSRAVGKHVTTIEGLSKDLSHPLQRAWIEIDVPQCGYCQSGQIMSAAILLKENSKPTDKDIDEAMSGNICRCGTYSRIRRAIHRAAEMAAEKRSS